MNSSGLPHLVTYCNSLVVSFSTPKADQMIPLDVHSLLSGPLSPHRSILAQGRKDAGPSNGFGQLEPVQSGSARHITTWYCFELVMAQNNRTRNMGWYKSYCTELISCYSKNGMVSSN
jgi:hypothetical protein